MATLELAPPLTAYGTCAHWIVNNFEFYQFSPATADPYKEVVPFLRAAVEQARTGPVDYKLNPLPVPGYRLKAVGSQAKSMLPPDELIRIMFSYWPEISLTPPKRNAKNAYVWRIWWDVSTFDAAFRRFDIKGEVVPIHDFERQPFEQLAEVLGTSSALEELGKWM